jgi:hypothetical protein
MTRGFFRGALVFLTAITLASSPLAQQQQDEDHRLPNIEENVDGRTIYRDSDRQDCDDPNDPRCRPSNQCRPGMPNCLERIDCEDPNDPRCRPSNQCRPGIPNCLPGIFPDPP